ncbi:hypothetical protein RFI_23267 [Reticulomyxa filosa]|uniref:Phytanoyl-CoA dioxygenase n=1 Tax=Reticulomyxa filosa TaxID=46433 RepID=X6MKB5_RETFI|nr:hypothetical protein RFI_23267 [Reticulomyxa filosa]|eukprot:ETO14101.1 hypothetical protein RFI_23267 [Reticulomyxa filosa]
MKLFLNTTYVFIGLHIIYWRTGRKKQRRNILMDCPKVLTKKELRKMQVTNTNLQSKNSENNLNPENLRFFNTAEAPYRFASLNNEARDYLNKNGFVALKNVLSEVELAEAEKNLWKFLSQCGMKQDDISTWKENIFPGCLLSGLVWNFGAGQSDFQWYIRTRPSVLDAFVKLWEVNSYEDLLVSMDGLAIFRPWKQRTQWKTVGGWYHIDQNVIMKPKLCSYQGYVTLYDQNQYTGGTTVIPTTQQDIVKTMGPYCSRPSDYIEVPHHCKAIFSREKWLICLEKGDLFIWDSRLVHCSSPAIDILPDQQTQKSNDQSQTLETETKEDDNASKPKLLRAASMVTFAPKSLLNRYNKGQIIQERVNAFLNNQTCSHWPTQCKILGGRSTGKPKQLPQNDLKKLSRVGKSLIGVDILKECDDKWKDYNLGD